MKYVSCGKEKRLESANTESSSTDFFHEKDVLLPDEVAVRLRVPLSWIYAHEEQIAGFFRLGRYVRFRRAIFERWLEGTGTCQ